MYRTPLSLLAVATFGALFLGSTGATEDPPEPPIGNQVVAHCDAIADLSTCLEYGTKAEAEADCVSFDGTVGDGACPAEGLAGACDHDGKSRRYYTTGGSPNTADYAERHCKNAMAGSFSAAP